MSQLLDKQKRIVKKYIEVGLVDEGIFELALYWRSRNYGKFATQNTFCLS